MAIGAWNAWQRVTAAFAVVLASVGATGVALVANAQPSAAASCTDSWQGPATGSTNWNASASDWSAGFPTGSSVVCISEAGTYTVDLTASASIGTLQVGGATSGTQTVLVSGASTSVELALASASTVEAGGVLDLAPSTGGFAWLGGPGAVTVDSGGSLTTTGSTSTAYLRDDIINDGTVTIGSSDTLQDQNTATTNDGTFTVATGGSLTVSGGGGSFTNAGTLTVTGGLTESNGTFTQTSGSISGSPVVLTGGSLADTAGTGAFDVQNTLSLSGTIPAGQTVTVDGVHTSVAVTLTTAVTDDGTLTLAPGGGGYALVEGDALTVASGGSFTTTGTTGNAYLRVPLTNQADGTVTIGSSDTLQDQNTADTNAGTFQVSNGGKLSMSSSSIITNTGTLGTTVDATGPTTSGITGGEIAAGGTFEATTIGSPTVGTVFTPISGATITGAFSNLEYGPYGYSTSVSTTSVTITATAIPFSVASKAFSPTAHEPTSYSVGTITTSLGTPTYTATINWGDSTSSAGTVTSGTVSGSHSFASPGPSTVTVTVHASDGTTLSSSRSITVKADPIPTVTSVSPDVVLEGATNKVLTLTGTGLTDNATPSFSASGISVVSTTYVSASKLTVKVDIAPTATLGAGDVTVTTDGGSATCTGCLTVDAVPMITTITPKPAIGATTTLTVTGTGFQAGLVVTSTVPGATFGSVSGSSATTFQVPITIPSGTSAGTYTLTVTNPDGGKVSKSITVPPVPTVTASSPNVVLANTTGKILTISGTGFDSTSVASFSASGISVVSTTYVSPTKLTAKVDIASTATLGAGNVTVTTDGGAGTCTGCLTVDARPTITTISPKPAPGTTTTLTVTGTGFQAGLVVTSTVPGATIGSVSGSSATTFQVPITIPSGTSAGTYTLTVTNPDGGKVSKSMTVS
ncbi:MAG: hypothetical protein ABSF84_16970 [Acidimicrobiales bacterium]